MAARTQADSCGAELWLRSGRKAALIIAAMVRMVVQVTSIHAKPYQPQMQQREIIGRFQKYIFRHTARGIEAVDTVTANVVCQVYEALSPDKREKFRRLPAGVILASVAGRLPLL